MYFSISFEADRLCLKDLSHLVTDELNQRLKADATAMEKVFRFFGLKGDPSIFLFLPIEYLFPDTTVSVLKECFEVLRLYDLAEILAKVKPRALCPALSPEQAGKLLLGDRRTKNYSNIAVVVVDVSSEKGTAKMIEKFFKDLNPKNEVDVIPFTNLKEKFLLWEKINENKLLEMDAIEREKFFRNRLEIEHPKRRKRIEASILGEGFFSEFITRLETEEHTLRKKLEIKMEKITELREEIKWGTKRLEDIERESSDAESALLNVMDKWIQDQGW